MKGTPARRWAKHDTFVHASGVTASSVRLLSSHAGNEIRGANSCLLCSYSLVVRKDVCCQGERVGSISIKLRAPKSPGANGRRKSEAYIQTPNPAAVLLGVPPFAHSREDDDCMRGLQVEGRGGRIFPILDETGVIWGRMENLRLAFLTSCSTVMLDATSERVP